MSSPAARAEARRKAILSRGGDRLAKLTTSARGEDAPAYVQDKPTRFVGEQAPSPSPSPPDPSVWSPEQQHQFMQALMNPTQPADDPFTSMMAQLNQGATGKAPEPAALPKPPSSRMQKWLPLVHLVSMWSLLAVFVLWQEPRAFVQKTAGAVELAFWRRWPKLTTQGTLDGPWGVQIVPFFWAFMTLQVMLHSLRIFTGHNEVQPPALLALALPHLPLPLPSLIINGLRYFRMASVFLDDIAAIVFGIGIIISITSWLVD